MLHIKKTVFFVVTLSFLWAEHNHTNALIQEDSPYLQQHAHNPVNWYPWGKEALDKARKENKMIFLSIGYSTCHWCHVMEEESFTSDAVAVLLNESYVSIKVDREELSQLDKKYQRLYMSVHGKRGGWPLSVFMSPEAEVFHVATYIPRDGYGSMGLMSLLPSFTRLQKEKAGQFQLLVEQHKQAALRGNTKAQLNEKLNADVMDKAVREITTEFDPQNGGFALRPKFPEASKLALLIDIYQLSGNKKAFYMAQLTLRKMAEGGIYDQIGGGFFRYTTDRHWQMPHFEKMLYTNAELLPVYVRMYELTTDPLYQKIVYETIAQMEKHFMQEGLYLTASDADSNGEEGGYFIYEYAEVKKYLLTQGWDPREIEEVLAYLGIEEDGNIDGDFSHTHITGDKVPLRLEEVKTYLREVRSKRTFPFIDSKVITAWNAMMIKALFVASRLDRQYLTLAEQRLDALLKKMSPQGILYHQTLPGKAPKQEGLLEDYAFLIDAMIEGYERTYNKTYLTLLQSLTKEALDKFYRKKQWYLSDDSIRAEADFDDRYYTSALSVMLENLVRLAGLTEELSYAKIVKETIQNTGAVLKKSPAKAPKLLHAFLRLKMGDVIIKSKIKNLQKSRKEIDAIDYPFILSKFEESDKYLACRINSCFAYDTNITALINYIEKELK
ncbi:hypothetical protein TSL6_18230 [Sulfurovum sp. TSL6]|uniref:thioredoxin domain-containing protein n=1 Tax=Sulfurovum sp. TSL6 TaxID=2826995 RepID=UPI001CC7AD29|nr:thioredoxin domain-containing protein [Sulfurovum sp. TSL6]GIU01317.1 hypothetical protein TSL6_18230 [Sulfurovum sp. TSL6]